MEKRVIVISLGGSLIAPDSIDTSFLNKFKEVLWKHSKNYKFVVVCGGGKIARHYINALGKIKKKKSRKIEFIQGLFGIAITRLNSKLLGYFFGRRANKKIPKSMKDVENLLKVNDFVFCGALRYGKKETSDSTAAKLARYFSTEFINLTNVDGLYDKDPKKHKDARFIPEISFDKFLKMIKKLKYKPGQHFVLDQHGAKIIKKYRITTYILGKDLRNLDALLSGKHFVGTIIS